MKARVFFFALMTLVLLRDSLADSQPAPQAQSPARAPAPAQSQAQVKPPAPPAPQPSPQAQAQVVPQAQALTQPPQQMNLATAPSDPALDSATYKILRDPFKPPQLSTKMEAPKTDLELVNVSDLQMVGVLSGVHNKNRAMLRIGGGKVYIVSEGTRVGKLNGYIRRIMEDRVLVNETIVDIVGDKEVVSREIRMANKPNRLGSGPLQGYSGALGGMKEGNK